MRRVLAVGVGWWLLVDLLRVWTPSLITVFGQAASTPAELMGGFALLVTLACFVPLLLVRHTALAAITALGATLLLALVCRVALQLVGGGPVQLWVASVGVACALAWVCLAARSRGGSAVEGYAAGLALAVTSHAALGTWGAVWRDDAWAWLLVLVQVVLVAVALRDAGSEDPEEPAASPVAWALLPSYLLAGVWAANPARASATEEVLGPLAVTVAAFLALGLARGRPPGPVPSAVAGLVLTGGTAMALVPQLMSAWALLAFGTGLPALVVVLRALAGPTPTPDRRDTAPMFAAGGGAVLWVLLFFAYYAGYDLGYRADALLVLLAAGLAGLGVLRAVRRTHHGHRIQRPHRQRLPRSAAVGVGLVAAMLVGLGPGVTVPTVDEHPDDHDGIRILAWNLRMGYGMDGEFEPREVAELVSAADPDVVLLSEIDRAWLLNGGQDQLRILACLLDMEAYFGPAADPVWGDAVLTDLPVARIARHPLPSYDAVTGAQVLAVEVVQDGQLLTFASTHVQPHGGEGDGALEQARDIAALAAGWAEAGPVVLGGDFNLEPGDPSWRALRDAGLVDALAGARPLPTSPADAPETQIDHVFTTPGLVASEPGAIRTELSDHLPVVVTLTAAD